MPGPTGGCVCEFARNVAGLTGATSAEFDENADYTVIDLMPEQEDVEDKGGTMRLGAYPCKLEKGSLAHEVYGEEVIYERHRHRYEVNNAYRDTLTGAGLRISGLSPDGRLTEMVEIPGHPWFLASQGHPEFKSRPTKPPPAVRGIRWRGLEASRVTSAVFALLLWGARLFMRALLFFFSVRQVLFCVLHLAVYRGRVPLFGIGQGEVSPIPWIECPRRVHV